MEENRQILELLERMEKNSRRQVRLGRIQCILALAAAGFCGAAFLVLLRVLPQILEVLPQIDSVLNQMQTVLGNLETTTQQLAQIDLTGMVTDVDALVTDAPDVPLVCFSADCVPILFADGKTHAVGCAHSGWRGTVGNIIGEVLKVMKKEYGTDPADITAAIGPSICRDCYEVGYDVIGEFEKSYPSSLHDRLFLKKNDGKYLLDLWEACRQNLLDAGVSAGNISLPDVCTRCNPDLLFSHRIQHGRQGNLGAFIIRRN